MAYLLSDDLIFISRISGTARDLGLVIQSVRDPKRLVEGEGLVLLDLHFPGLNLEEVVAAVKEKGPRFLVGYGSHVDAATLKRAREAGVDVVLPRSKFVEDLPTALPRWFQGHP